MKTIIIDSERQKNYCRTMIDQIKLDGKSAVVFKKTDMSSTEKQRGLKWRWNKDIADSGLGENDTPKSAHLWNKKEFGHPILMRDNNNYAITFKGFRERVIILDDYVDRMKWFISNYVRTEKFNRSQQVEYLIYIQKYWVRKGVNLTDPNDYGKNLLRFKPEIKKLAPAAGTITAVTESRPTTER